MNQKSSAGSPGHSQVEQTDEMQMNGELSDLTSCKKCQPSHHDFAGNLLESGLSPRCIPLPEPEITHPSREEAQPLNRAAAEPSSSEGRELITRKSSLQSDRQENDSSTSSASGDRGENFPPQVLLEARLVEEGQKPEIVDAMSVEMEILEPEEKPLKWWIGWGSCALIVVVVSVTLGVLLGPKSEKTDPDTGTMTLAPSASPTFDRGISWKQLGSVIYGEDENDVSGSQLKLSHDGTVVAIASYQNNGAHGAKSGHIRVYKWYDDSQGWLQLGEDIDGPGPYGYIARTTGSLALSGDGNVVAFASTWTNVASRGTYVYAWDSNQSIWKQRGSSNVEGEEPPIVSGYTLDLSEDGNILAASSKLSDSLDSPAGKVTIFQWNKEQAAWEQRGETLPMEGNELDDRTFGNAISMSADGSVFAASIRSPIYEEGLEGLTRVYTWDGFAWSQLGQDLPGYTGQDSVVETEDLSSDGRTLAIKLSDRIVIVTWDETTGQWLSKGDTVPGECDHISLSGDGDRFAAAFWDNYRQSSEAFLYEWSGDSWTRQGWMPLGYQEIVGHAEYLSLSGNGQVLAIGDFAADHQVDTSVVLQDTGAVWLYAWPLENETL